MINTVSADIDFVSNRNRMDRVWHLRSHSLRQEIARITVLLPEMLHQQTRKGLVMPRFNELLAAINRVQCARFQISKQLRPVNV